MRPMSSTRKARRRRWRKRSLRRLVRCRCTRKRKAGKGSVLGFWRMMRCKRTGTPARKRPPSRAGKTKLIISKPFLPLQQVLHEGLIEADAGVHRHVVDVRLGAFRPVKILK